jgi:hypothetical protein
MKLTKKKIAVIEKFLRELNIDIDVIQYVYIELIDMNNPFESIQEMIDNNNGFNVEIIYYTNAIKFLSENDPSLTDSMSLANECGFTLNKINSELLASLLASDMVRTKFSELEFKITNFFDELK